MAERERDIAILFVDSARVGFEGSVKRRASGGRVMVEVMNSAREEMGCEEEL